MCQVDRSWSPRTVEVDEGLVGLIYASAAAAAPSAAAGPRSACWRAPMVRGGVRSRIHFWKDLLTLTTADG